MRLAVVILRGMIGDSGMPVGRRGDYSCNKCSFIEQCDILLRLDSLGVLTAEDAET